VTDDLALIEPLVLTTKSLVTQLRQFNHAIREFDHKIKEPFKSHPDHFLFESFPGLENSWLPVSSLYLVRIELAGKTLLTSKNIPASLPWSSAAASLFGCIDDCPAHLRLPNLP
jgi:hypothetical protein